MRYNPPPRFCDMCFIAHIENLCFKNCERPPLVGTKSQLLMQITFEGSPYINLLMINLKKNGKEMTQLLEWSCLSGPQWLLYCVAVPTSLYGPVPSWPGGIGADGDDYSKVSLAKQVSLNIKFPVGHWPIWCQDLKKTTLTFFSAATITTRTLSTESSTSTANQSVRCIFWSMKIFVKIVC